MKNMEEEHNEKGYPKKLYTNPYDDMIYIYI